MSRVQKVYKAAHNPLRQLAGSLLKYLEKTKISQTGRFLFFTLVMLLGVYRLMGFGTVMAAF
jgi:hypothetical protein